MIPQGTVGDILSNQHLLPLTTEVYQQMICHVVTYCVMMRGFDKRESEGVSLDMRERSARREAGGSGGERRLTQSWWFV